MLGRFLSRLTVFFEDEVAADLCMGPLVRYYGVGNAMFLLALVVVNEGLGSVY